MNKSQKKRLKNKRNRENHAIRKMTPLEFTIHPPFDLRKWLEPPPIADIHICMYEHIANASNNITRIIPPNLVDHCCTIWGRDYTILDSDYNLDTLIDRIPPKTLVLIYNPQSTTLDIRYSMF